MTISLSFITGVMLGFEMYEDEEGKFFIADLLILRMIICKS